MSDNLIVVFYAEDKNKNGGNNIQNNNTRKDTYLKNACVTLVSAKKHNPNTDVALITNTDISEKYLSVMNEHGILLFVEEYDDFLFDNGYQWSLAFYRFCALSHLLKKYSYSRFVMLECDMFVQANLDCVFEECDQNIILHDVNHGLNNDNYRLFVNEIEQFLKNGHVFPVQYEGGFLAINREQALAFQNECKRIYNKMVEEKFITRYGDMFILSVAAYNMRQCVKNGGAYVHIFWTGWFHLVSTCYKYNAVSVLHLPDEKEDGLIKLFDKYIEKGKFPSNQTVWTICHIKKMKLTTRIVMLLRRIWAIFE